MQKVFVTGAGGFVGHYLLEVLENDYKVIGVHHERDASEDNKVTHIKGDILSSTFLHDSLNKYKPEYIVHLAARAINWFKNSPECYKVNLEGTLNLYESILKIRAKSGYNPKILYISTSDCYGKTENPKNIKEDAPLFPTNHYSASKTAADRASFAYSQLEKLNIIILRPFSHIGPRQNKGFFVPDMASQIAETEKKPNGGSIFAGNLETVRDYLDVRDVVAAYKLILETNLPSGECFNICSGNGIRTKKILDLLLSFSDKKIEVKNDPSRIRQADTPIYVGNNEKLKKATGWKQKIPLEQTLRETLDFWRNI
jgi:GDP-4-dehydro-6-deoxy-D-mannose reductase